MFGVQIAMVNLDCVPVWIWLFGQYFFWNLTVMYKSDRFKTVTYIYFTIGLPIRQIACGSYHSIILTFGGTLYQLGSDIPLVNRMEEDTYLPLAIKLPWY